MKKQLFLTLVLTVFSYVLSSAQTAAPQLGKDPVSAVVKAMTLDEKIDLVVGQGMFLPGLSMPGANAKPTPAQQRVLGAAGTTVAIPRLGIPALVVCDGPAGIHPFNAGKSRMYYATAWPTGTLLASSWDTAIIKNLGTSFGNEAKEYGIDIILGPGMNIHRNPLGGRNFEYYSEDPIITGNIAAAIVSGIQSAGVGTSIKHFALNNQETNRNTVDVKVSERALRELYLRGWQIAVKKSNPWTVMSSYNKINGTYTSEEPDLLTTILRKEWGYKGFVMTDWFGGKNAVAQQKAGNNLLMPGTGLQKTALKDAITKGLLDEKTLDENVTGILDIILKTPSYKNYNFSDNPPLTANAQVARKAAAESMILLKNESLTLPLATGAKVAVFGNNGVELIAGGTGSGDVGKMYTVSLSQGLFNAGFTVNSRLFSLYNQHVETEKGKKPKKSPFEELMSPFVPLPEMVVPTEEIEKASTVSDIAIISIGRNAGEANDRKLKDDFLLTETEKNVLEKVSAAFHAKGKKVVVVLNIGAPIDVAWSNLADAILLAWQPGMEGGNAMADILSGKVNPSGRLATSFPIRYEDDATAKNFPGKTIPGTQRANMMGQPESDAEVTYEEGIYVGYRYYSTFGVKTAYPFGHGLSYTQFAYENLKLSAPEFKDQITVSLTVRNTGNLSGKEVVELYLTAPSGKLDKPALELKAFAKTNLLKPGDSQELSFTLTPEQLASFHTNAGGWIAEAGNYTIKFGNAENTITSASFKLSKELVVEKVNKVLVPKSPITDLKPITKAIK